MKGVSVIVAPLALLLLLQTLYYRFSSIASPCFTEPKHDITSLTPRLLEGVYKHNISNLQEATPCSEDQRKNISRIFRLDLRPDAPGGGGQKIRQWTKCPASTWLEHYYGTGGYYVHKDNLGFLGLSVGCNKAHDAISMARMGTSDPDFDTLAWENAISKVINATYACGMGRKIPLANRSKRDGEVHCIEPMPATFAALKNASIELGHMKRKKFILSNAAISTANGIARFPKANAGKEAYGIHTCQHKPHDCISVPMYTLEEYVRVFVQSNGPIDILQIDVEGWDYDVLFAAGSVLDRTNYLEFEYHISGPWGNLHLQDVIRLLDRKGFTCYWAGVEHLIRITSCYFDVYDKWHGWSNVACVHRSVESLAHGMEQMFHLTLK